eukprot:g74747.t1
MDKLNIQALRQALREKGASTKGSKAILRDRLAAIYDKEGDSAAVGRQVPSKVRVCVESRGSKRASCLVQLGLANKTLCDLLSKAENKFKKKFKRAFLSVSGVELEEANVLELLRDGVQVVVTGGENFAYKKRTNSENFVDVRSPVTESTISASPAQSPPPNSTDVSVIEAMSTFESLPLPIESPVTPEISRYGSTDVKNISFSDSDIRTLAELSDRGMDLSDRGSICSSSAFSDDLRLSSSSVRSSADNCEQCKDLRAKLSQARDKMRASQSKESKAKEELNRLSIKLAAFKNLQDKHRDSLATIATLSRENQKLSHKQQKMQNKQSRLAKQLEDTLTSEEVLAENERLRKRLAFLEAKESLASTPMPQLKELLQFHSEGLVKAQAAMMALIEKEAKGVREKTACKICFEHEACVLLQPCCHLVTCSLCTESLNLCPICRGPIDDTNPVYT